MELISLYLYTRIPLETKNVSNKTFHNMKRNGWYTDSRTNRKFTMLNKRIEVENQWYRAMIRFEYANMMEGKESFILSLPAPFIVTACEPLVSVSVARWKDTKAYHGVKLGVKGLLQEGVPINVIDEVIRDLETHIEYN